jgi:hypothetical protein
MIKLKLSPQWNAFKQVKAICLFSEKTAKDEFKGLWIASEGIYLFCRSTKSLYPKTLQIESIEIIGRNVCEINKHTFTPCGVVCSFYGIHHTQVRNNIYIPYIVGSDCVMLPSSALPYFPITIRLRRRFGGSHIQRFETDFKGDSDSASVDPS